ncbi:MAG: hypothetical protein CMM29_10810 [Rhodospirillaceae bacterium]|nr:hypothetical protein [Rhodospirillaceae bacterium]
MIDDCIRRPLLTAEAVSQGLTNRISELMDAAVSWHDSHDDHRMSAAEELGHSAFWTIITELQQWRDRIDLDIDDMLNEQAQAYQDRAYDKAIHLLEGEQGEG